LSSAYFDKLISFPDVATATADKVLGFLAVVTDTAPAGWADWSLFFGTHVGLTSLILIFFPFLPSTIKMDCFCAMGSEIK